MFFDLNVPIKKTQQRANASKKGKQPQQEIPASWTPSEISDLESRIDLLIHLGYSVIGLSQTVHKKVDPKTHVNVLDSLLGRLQTRPGIVFLKRLNIVLDSESEKGFGLINANVALFNGYDLIALVPTTHNTLSLACLTHSMPTPLTAHIISLPLTLPRLPYHLKHTLIRTALKNGAVFEINYVGALGGENDPVLVDANVAESGASAKRNWWASTRELVRVTKGKGLIVSGGVIAEADLRSPRDIGNIISLLGLSQDAAHDALTKTPKSLIIRAETRKTYRAVLSEPKVVFPPHMEPMGLPTPQDTTEVNTLKRAREDNSLTVLPPSTSAAKKKKRKPNKEVA
ncbi:Ribonuclease P protein subunit p30 [Psilocybe cubensis]|uniref:Ribonuclease P protein subunit p30 n=2 Tax=Psilocybe cubensis TaxID=181762 RepID=A0ACB8GKT0_PSICU|nr:Ribonuclease P protein subunit p30 [Psilocybe cubensis]KAH9476298.1 Ribonuclease P protein subunit p30 [Psilocybe cubensis]